MASLYELNQSFNNLARVLENTEDQDLKEVLENCLNELQMETNTKIENIIKFIKNLESDLLAYDNEIRRLQEKRNASKNKMERLKDYLKDFMVSSDKTKYKSGVFTASIRVSEAVKVDNVDTIPSEFKTTTINVNKTMLKMAIKEGKEIKGAKIVKNKSVNIK